VEVPYLAGEVIHVCRDDGHFRQEGHYVAQGDYRVLQEARSIGGGRRKWRKRGKNIRKSECESECESGRAKEKTLTGLDLAANRSVQRTLTGLDLAANRSVQRSLTGLDLAANRSVQLNLINRDELNCDKPGRLLSVDRNGVI
jgi:hypothetical protein